MVSANDVANEALQNVGNNQPFVSGGPPNWDNSSQGRALQKLYAPTVAAVQRQWGWDASRNAVALTLTGNPSPIPWFLSEYLYPANGIEVWQLVPAVTPDANNPLPVLWDVGNNVVNGVQTKVIWTSLVGPLAIYNNNPSEGTWDALFRQAVVKMLSSVLSLALAGKPDLAEGLLQAGAAYETLAEGRPD